jgi:hypothetical protein
VRIRCQIGLVTETTVTTRPFSGYALRGVVVGRDLDAVRGSLGGQHQLPLHPDYLRPGGQRLRLA